MFAGCSFTWGQGLYFYSGLPSCVEQPYNKYDHNLVNHTQIEQAARLRFPRLVADHFGTAEIVDRVNGGSHQSILKWWNTALFTDTKFLEKYGRTDIPIEDIGLVVMQLTQSHRCCYDFNGVINAFFDIANDRKQLKKFMETNNFKTFEDYSFSSESFMSLTLARIEFLRGNLMMVISPDLISKLTNAIKEPSNHANK